MYAFRETTDERADGKPFELVADAETANPLRVGFFASREDCLVYLHSLRRETARRAAELRDQMNDANAEVADLYDAIRTVTAIR